MSEQNEAEFDRFAEEYDMLQKENLGIFGKDLSVFSRYKIKLLKSLLDSEPESIIEFGCGVGRNIPHLHHFFPKASISGCDTSAKSLELASQHNPQALYSVISKPVDLAEFYPEGADLILITCVLHHIPCEEHQKWLGALWGILKPGGRIAIFEHNPFNPVTRHMFNTCPYDADAQLLYPQKCRQLLKQTGANKVNLYYTLFFIWRTPLWERLEQMISWLPLGGQYCVFADKE